MQLQALDYQQIAYPDWLAMWLDYVGTSVDSMPTEVHRITFERVKGLDPSLRGFVAFSEVPLGFVHYYFHPSTYRLNDACTIEDLYVSPAARGMGVGRWLVEIVASQARQAGAPALHWRTGASNHKAIALYEKLATQTGVLSYRMQL